MDEKLFKKASLKLNINIIVRMSGKMRVGLNEFSYDVMKISVGEAASKNLCILGKNNDLELFRFYSSEYFKGGPRANVSNAFLFNTALLNFCS